MSITKNLQAITSKLPEDVTLVAVSKTKPISAIQEAYNAGQRVFGENKIQEMTEKYNQLPKDIEWHMIGHLQSNKVKYMARYVSLVHGVDKLSTLKEINKQAKKHNRIINCLLQAKIAQEDTKFGLSFNEIESILTSNDFKELKNVSVTGLMGMATFTDNTQQIITEFNAIHTFFKKVKKSHQTIKTLSIGMSGDYQIAIENGSTMVRIGSAIFGNRNY